MPELPIRNSEEFEVGNGKNYLHPKIGSEQKRPGANRPPEFVPESPLQKGVFGGMIFSPRNYGENAHSKSANFEGRHSGGHLLGRPLLFTSDKKSPVFFSRSVKILVRMVAVMMARFPTEGSSMVRVSAKQSCIVNCQWSECQRSIVAL